MKKIYTKFLNWAMRVTIKNISTPFYRSTIMVEWLNLIYKTCVIGSLENLTASSHIYILDKNSANDFSNIILKRDWNCAVQFQISICDFNCNDLSSNHAVVSLILLMSSSFNSLVLLSGKWLNFFYFICSCVWNSSLINPNISPLLPSLLFMFL